MKLWQVIILIMIILRIVMFIIFYFYNLKDYHKSHSKYDTKHEWILVIISIVFFVEIYLFNYFFYRIGELANKCNNFIYNVVNDLAYKICKKIENDKKIDENKEIEK